MVGADVVGAILPVAMGPGGARLGMKLLSKAEEAGGAAKAVDKAVDAGKAADKTADAAKAQNHHIATGKAIVSGYTKQFTEILEKAGMSLQDPANRILLEGHSGRHAEQYRNYILQRLKGGTKGLSGEKYRKALETTLGELKDELLKNPDMIRGEGLVK